MGFFKKLVGLEPIFSHKNKKHRKPKTRSYREAKSTYVRKSISKSLRTTILVRDGYKCQYCGASYKDCVFEIDHIIPVSKGGTNDPSNLQVLCKSCNRGKGAN